MENTLRVHASNNRGQLVGVLNEDVTKTFEVEGEKFYEGKIEIERLSDNVDILPFTISEKLVRAYNLKLEKGEEFAFGGELRSYNRNIDGKSRLILSFFVKEVLNREHLFDENTNMLHLVGFICKEPNYRITPFNREICDVLLAVNRIMFNKSDYIPCILWGRNAKLIQNQKVGTKIDILGRIQSRVYKKEVSEGVFEEKTAYEVSVQKLQIPDKEEVKNSDEIGA